MTENTSRSAADYQTIARELRNCKRVAIVGNQGAGKTTLANRLADIIGIPYVLVPWSKEMSPVEVGELRAQMSEKEIWIIDGDFELLPLADMVIFLKFSVWFCFVSDIKRRFTHLRQWEFHGFSTLWKVVKRIGETINFWPHIYWNPSKASSSLRQLEAVHAGRVTSMPASPLSAANQSTTPKMVTLKSRQEVQLLLAAFSVS